MQNQEICKKVRVLLYRAELNIDICLKIQKYLNGKSRYLAKEAFFILTANNAFNEAITILHTLLGQNIKEVNLLKLGIETDELNEIKNKFKIQKFTAIRDKLIAHKDKSVENDHTDHIWYLVAPERTQIIAAMIDTLNKIVYENFEVKFDPNNPFVQPLKGLCAVIKEIKI